MRELIIERLNKCRVDENNFNRNTMRWRNFTVDYQNKVYHISEIQWEWLSDVNLLLLFERLIRMMSKIM